MKRVIRNDELYEKMEEAINLLCGVVKTTLGPLGNNSIINTSLRTPFITNDGVTIAKEIVSEDVSVNTILDIAKEASIKTNEIVGDGTTTTLVLLESIFNEGLELIRKGINPIEIKNELEKTLFKSLNYLDSISFKPNIDDYKKVAVVSSNDEEIGNFISNVYSKIKNKNGIKITESDNINTEILYFDGYLFDTVIASSYYFQSIDKIVLKDSLILIVDDVLNDMELLGEVFNEIISKQKNLIVIAKDYSEDFINNCLILYLENNINVILLKNPMYGEKQIIFNQDLACLSQAKVVNRNEIISFNSIGHIKGIEINKQKTIINYDENEEISKRIIDIENNLKSINEEFERDYYEERLAMFKNGLANILVGGITKIECTEKKMRYDDALCAISVCEKGILPGGGIALLKLSNYLNDNSFGNTIFKKSLLKPFLQLIENAGKDSLFVLSKLKESNYDMVYNVRVGDFESISNTMILDPLLVVKESLSNAVSIASMLLTTTSLIINEENIDKNITNEI